MPPTYLLAAIAVTVAMHLVIPVAVPIPVAWRFIGFLPIAIGILLNIAADRQFKQLGTTVKSLQRSSALATDGVFQWSRNPMYLGMVLIVAGVALLEGTAVAWLAVAALAIILDQAFIRREERMLEETFGAEFEAYTRRTRRWL